MEGVWLRCGRAGASVAARRGGGSFRTNWTRRVRLVRGKVRGVSD